MSAYLDSPTITRADDGTFSVRWPDPPRSTYECAHEVVQMFVDGHNALVDELRIANERGDEWRRLVHEDTLAYEEAIARVSELEDALRAARAEIDRHGHGDFHYGVTPRDPGVLSALAAIDALVGSEERT
jgi:hypothetical protein